MQRIYLSSVLLAAVGATACSGEPSPVVVGHVGSGELARALTTADDDWDDDWDDDDDDRRRRRTLEIVVNDQPRRVRLDSDGTFVLQEIPTGELTLAFESSRISGSVTLHEVRAGEVVELAVRLGDGELDLHVLRRDRGPVEVLPPREGGGAVDIRGHDTVYHLDARTYGDVVIHGDRVTLVGPGDDDCDEGARAVVEGDLVVRGHDVRVINVRVRGRTDIRGDRVRVLDVCD